MLDKLKPFYRILRWVKNSFFLNSSQFGFFGKNVKVAVPFQFLNKHNVYLYDNVSIGPNCTISGTNAKFIMKSYSLSAENLMVRTGNHMFVLGKNFREINDEYKRKSGKLSEYDRDVVVEEHVWLGCNVTLLAGVTVGRGSTIGAGSVVSKSIPPYSIAVGVPCKVIKFRWSVEEILEHEKALYPENNRLSKEQLEDIFLKYKPLH